MKEHLGSFLLVATIFLCFSALQAQNWVNGGNTLAANGTLGTNSNHSLLFETNATERGRITNGGNWAIGSTGTTSRFTVNTVAGASPFRAQVNGATKLLVNGNGGVSIGSSVAGPPDGLYVASQVGIGTSNAGSWKVRIVHGSFGLNLHNSGTSDHWELWTHSNGMSLYANGTLRGHFNETTGAYSAVSDERLKTNMKAMPSVLEKINQLKPTTYEFKNAVNAQESYGFLAQEVQKVFPHLVNRNVSSERGLDVYTLDYSGFGVLAIKAIQELSKKTDEIEELKKELAELKHLVSKLTNSSTTTLLSSASLDGIRPNPAKGSASIRYSIPEGSNRAQLLITDALGRTVKTVQLTKSGTININVSSLAAGVYHYSLVVDNKTMETRKMTVVR